LINLFYPKDPHASVGKHVLTPSLALNSAAGATPPDRDSRYWDENLLQGPPPSEPFPRVVGITMHLNFSAGRMDLAAVPEVPQTAGGRARGSAIDRDDGRFGRSVSISS
jgi:hypothetical protein